VEGLEIVSLRFSYEKSTWRSGRAARPQITGDHIYFTLHPCQWHAAKVKS